MKINKLLILTGKIEIEVIILWLDIYGLDLNGQKYSNLIYNSMQCSECMLFWGTRSMHLKYKSFKQKDKALKRRQKIVKWNERLIIFFSLGFFVNIVSTEIFIEKAHCVSYLCCRSFPLEMSLV